MQRGSTERQKPPPLNFRQRKGEEQSEESLCQLMQAQPLEKFKDAYTGRQDGSKLMRMRGEVKDLTRRLNRMLGGQQTTGDLLRGWFIACLPQLIAANRVLSV